MINSTNFIDDIINNVYSNKDIREEFEENGIYLQDTYINELSIKITITLKDGNLLELDIQLDSYKNN